MDIARRNLNVCALQYAAHDARQAIEQLFFEEIVLSVGTAFDHKEYEKCRGNSTKLHKVLKKLSPDYVRLAQFTQAIISTDPKFPPLVIWDHEVLIKQWKRISTYLHWAGEACQTVQCNGWIDKGIGIIKQAADYIWANNGLGFTAILRPENMQPEIKDCWESFRRGDIDLSSVRRIGNITLPILIRRTGGGVKGPKSASANKSGGEFQC